MNEEARIFVILQALAVFVGVPGVVVAVSRWRLTCSDVVKT